MVPASDGDADMTTMLTTIYAIPVAPTALVAERDGRWYTLQAPWQSAWAMRQEIRRPLSVSQVSVHRNSPLALLSDIPSIATLGVA